MPRIMVLAMNRQEHPTRIAYSEHVTPDILDDEHASVQFLERLAWALTDAETIERVERADADALRAIEGSGVEA